MSKLYNLPKDLLVKPFETIQKEYEKCILLKTAAYNSNFLENSTVN